jgi:intraflagellar transport protein 88
MGTAQARLGTAMKSNQGTGFNSNKQPKDLHERIKEAEKKVEEKNEKTEEENFKEMEEEVHRLLEDSAVAKVKKNVNEALTKAKDAAAKERKIRNLRE